MKFKLAGKVLAELKKEFGREDDKLAKVVELKQGPQTMDKFFQMFRHIVKNNRYKSWVLVEEFKRNINSTIKQKLMETE